MNRAHHGVRRRCSEAGNSRKHCCSGSTAARRSHTRHSRSTIATTLNPLVPSHPAQNGLPIPSSCPHAHLHLHAVQPLEEVALFPAVAWQAALVELPPGVAARSRGQLDARGAVFADRRRVGTVVMHRVVAADEALVGVAMLYVKVFLVFIGGQDARDAARGRGYGMKQGPSRRESRDPQEDNRRRMIRRGSGPGGCECVAKPRRQENAGGCHWQYFIQQNHHAQRHDSGPRNYSPVCSTHYWSKCLRNTNPYRWSDLRMHSIERVRSRYGGSTPNASVTLASIEAASAGPYDGINADGRLLAPNGAQLVGETATQNAC